MITDINSEDRLVQKTFADHLHDALGWECVYAYKIESFGPSGTLGRTSEREVVLVRDLRAALARLNSGLPETAREQAIEKLTRVDFARSLVRTHERAEKLDHAKQEIEVDLKGSAASCHRGRAR